VTKAAEKPPQHPPVRPRHPWRDTIEGMLGAAVLYMLITHFVVEVFSIPTGSMAPTLLGEYRDLKCPNCGLELPVDASATAGLSSGRAVAICPDCKYEFPPAKPRKPLSAYLPARLAVLLCGGNRVIVDRCAWDYPDGGLARLFYRSGLPRAFSPPKRWDVIVFQCPVADLYCRTCGIVTRAVRIDEGEKCPMCGSADVQIFDPENHSKRPKNYIKRLIGLPGETIRIRHGDIFVDGQPAVRPPEVQNAQWQFVYDSADVPKRPVEGVPAAWVVEQGAAKLDGAALRLTPSAGGRAEARYGRRISDISAYSGYDSRLEYYPVGEIKWDVEVTLDRAGILRLAIDEDELHYVGAVRFGTVAAKTSLRASGHGVTSVESEVAAEPGKPHRVTFTNASGRLELAVDGETVLSCAHPMPENEQTVSSGAALSVESAQAEFSRVRLCRSIYYRPPEANGSYAIDTSGRHVMMPFSLIGPDGYRLPEGQYLVLGDNQPNSWDSRYWGPVPRPDLIGRGVVLWWPLRMLRAIY
jgi:signal peptidase I